MDGSEVVELCSFLENAREICSNGPFLNPLRIVDAIRQLMFPGTLGGSGVKVTAYDEWRCRTAWVASRGRD